MCSDSSQLLGEIAAARLDFSIKEARTGSFHVFCSVDGTVVKVKYLENSGFQNGLCIYNISKENCLKCHRKVKCQFLTNA